MNILSLQILLNNFFSITCIKQENGVFKISRIALIKTLILFPLCLVGVKFTASILLEFHRPLTFNQRGITAFLHLMIAYLDQLIKLAAVFCVYAQIGKRKEIPRFLNLCVKFVKFSNSLDELKVFEKNCRKSYGLAITLMFLCFLIYFELLYFQTWGSFFYYLFSRSFELTILAYFGFIHLCLQFLVFSFEYLKTSFERDLKSSNERRIEQNLHLFISVERLLSEFNSTFGFTLSTMISFIVSMLTIQVIKL